MLVVETDIKKMQYIGAASYVIVYSGTELPCPVRIMAKLTEIKDGYVQIIPSTSIYELHYTQLEYPVEPKIYAIGDEASELLGSMRHKKIHINNWRAM